MNILEIEINLVKINLEEILAIPFWVGWWCNDFLETYFEIKSSVWFFKTETA